MTLPAGANLVMVVAFLAVVVIMVIANWRSRSRL